MNILFLIPARQGSKRIPNKNMRCIAGKPLIEHTMDAAIEACLQYGTGIDKKNTYIAVSTDDTEIIDNSHLAGKCLMITRPSKLATDDATIMPVIQHAIEFMDNKVSTHIDAVCLLQPTSPLRHACFLAVALKLFVLYKLDSLYSGYNMRIKTKSSFDSQLSPTHFQRNGAIFIAKRELIDKGKLWDENVFEFLMPSMFSVDIDTFDDLAMAEAIMEHEHYCNITNDLKLDFDNLI